MLDEAYTERESSNLTSFLKLIGSSIEVPNEDKIKVLRQLIVQEFLGPNQHVYKPVGS